MAELSIMVADGEHRDDVFIRCRLRMHQWEGPPGPTTNMVNNEQNKAMHLR